jgi:pimeloyl-ACP methyl ester carboxylesterase
LAQRRTSLGLAAEALIDRTFALTTSALVGAPPRDQVRRARDDVIAACQLFEARGWLADPAAYHRDPPALRAVEVAAGSTWGPRGRRRHRHATFASGYAPHEGEPGRERWLGHPGSATAHVYLLEHATPRPWLVCVHGFGMGSPRVNFLAFQAERLHRELGLNLAFPVLPLHGPRAGSRLSGREVLDADYLRMVHLFSQAVFEVRRIARWLRRRGEERVGVYGISLGAYVASLVASLEDDLDCVIAGIPAVDFSELARTNEPWGVSRIEQELRVDQGLVRAVTRPVSPLALAPRVPHAGRFIYAGLADRVVGAEQPRSLWRHWEEPEIHWFRGGHVLGVRHATIVPFVARALASVGMTRAAAAGDTGPR